MRVETRAPFVLRGPLITCTSSSCPTLITVANSLLAQNRATQVWIAARPKVSSRSPAPQTSSASDRTLVHIVHVIFVHIRDFVGEVSSRFYLCRVFRIGIKQIGLVRQNRWRNAVA